MKRTILFTILCVALSAPTWADYKTGSWALLMGDNKTALREFREAADQGHAKAQFELGLMYERGSGVPKDPAEAARWFKKAAAQGLDIAQKALGRVEEFPAQAETPALREIRRLAELGDANAQINLSAMYAQGQGVPTDIKIAAKWLQLAAKQGHADAQSRLGVIYEHGKGVWKNYKIALKWYRKAAEQGYARGQFNLGVVYEYGVGAPKDHETALEWYKLAAEQGYANAQLNLGLMYAQGQGTSVDHTRALMWWDISASQGVANAKRNRDIIKKVMNPTEIEIAKKLVREWTAKYQKNAGTKRKCTTHTLSVGNDSVAAPGVIFSLNNHGPNPVDIVFYDGKPVLGAVMTEDAGKESALFVGDERFDYYVKLTTPGDSSIIEFCK